MCGQDGQGARRGRVPAAQCPHRKPCSECQQGEKGERQSCLMMAGAWRHRSPDPAPTGEPWIHVALSPSSLSGVCSKEAAGCRSVRDKPVTTGR